MECGDNSIFFQNMLEQLMTLHKNYTDCVRQIYVGALSVVCGNLDPDDILGTYLKYFWGILLYSCNTCEEYEYIVNGQCSCQSGFERSADNSSLCVCPANRTLNVIEGKCQCPEGLLLNYENNTCECAQFRHLSNGVCICNQHFHYNPDTFQCECLPPSQIHGDRCVNPHCHK